MLSDPENHFIQIVVENVILHESTFFVVAFPIMLSGDDAEIEVGIHFFPSKIQFDTFAKKKRKFDANNRPQLNV